MEMDHKGKGLENGERLGVRGKVGVPMTGAESGSVLVEDVWIEGTVRTSSPVRVMGHIKGDLLAEDQVVISGDIEGDVSGRKIFFAGAAIRGDVKTAGTIQMDRDTAITGDLIARRVEMTGSVEGNLQVVETLLMGKTASVQGNITAGAVSIAEGAALKGQVEVRGLAEESEPPAPGDGPTDGEAPLDVAPEPGESEE